MNKISTKAVNRFGKHTKTQMLETAQIKLMAYERRRYHTRTIGFDKKRIGVFLLDANYVNYKMMLPFEYDERLLAVSAELFTVDIDSF